ncbi:hypothetical protein C8F04DRAFT_1183748 [Mycena alexandri]|nr:hypothetical protein C8F04DRAFT_1183748 [Mycena alexandri]
MHHIYSYHCQTVALATEDLKKAHDLGLFITNAVIQPIGTQQCLLGSPSPTLRLQQTFAQIGVRAKRPSEPLICSHYGREFRRQDLVLPVHCAAGARLDVSGTTRDKVPSDVKADVNGTTLGLYSFRIFADCQSNRKRPLAEDISKTAAPKKRKISLDLIENVDPVAVHDRILTCGQRKLL